MHNRVPYLGAVNLALALPALQEVLMQELEGDVDDLLEEFTRSVKLEEAFPGATAGVAVPRHQRSRTTGEQNAAGLTVRSGSGACRSPFAHAMRMPRRTAPDMFEGIAFRGLAPKDPDPTSVGIHAKNPRATATIQDCVASANNRTQFIPVTKSLLAGLYYASGDGVRSPARCRLVMIELDWMQQDLVFDISTPEAARRRGLGDREISFSTTFSEISVLRYVPPEVCHNVNVTGICFRNSKLRLQDFLRRDH